MKTPDESKCGMECIRTNVERLCIKPEKGQCPRCKQLVDDSIAYIQQLESRLAQVELERDGMAEFIKNIDPLSFSIIPVACRCCKNFDGNYTKDKCAFCQTYGTNANWQWRGVREENTKEEEK